MGLLAGYLSFLFFKKGKDYSKLIFSGKTNILDEIKTSRKSPYSLRYL